MRIIEWNCQGAFRNKFTKILSQKPDILIIPECECEAKLEFGKLIPKPFDFIWYGDKPNKGLAVFSYTNYKIEILKEFNPRFRYVLPLKVFNADTSFLLFAVWAMDNKEDRNSRYIAQVWLALNYYSRLLSHNCLLVGDFNSNQIWDEKDRVANHTDVVKLLESNDIHSLYHKQNNLLHGQEKDFTFFMYRKADKPFHIDYCFASKHLLDKGFEFQIAHHNDWITLSDHVPLIIDIQDKNHLLNINNSLLDFIEHNTSKFNILTIQKFKTTLNNLKSLARQIDLEEVSVFSSENKLKVINTFERLCEIDKHIFEIEKNGC